MQLSPQAFPVVQTLQHACACGVSAGGMIITSGVFVGVLVSSRMMVGMDVGRDVRVGPTVRVGPMVRVGARVTRRVAVTVSVSVAIAVRVGVFVHVAVAVSVAERVGGTGV
jgi:hypothetical protein